VQQPWESLILPGDGLWNGGIGLGFGENPRGEMRSQKEDAARYHVLRFSETILFAHLCIKMRAFWHHFDAKA
jgi:hypothetical protein